MRLHDVCLHVELKYWVARGAHLPDEVTGRATNLWLRSDK